MKRTEEQTARTSLRRPRTPDNIRSGAQATIRAVVDACTDCDTCRFLMDESCLFFPKLYTLWDEERASGRPIPAQELQKLAELCTLCGLCPCPNIRNDLMRAKAARVEKEGMPLGVRTLADIQRVARLGGLAPRLINRMLSIPPINQAIKNLLDIHPQRSLPRIAPESFFDWVHKNGLDQPCEAATKVAYFAGCTAGYLFPEVARAAVRVLQHNAVAVHVPPQQCCGMPTLLEGDRPTTLKRAGSNLTTLGRLAQEGYQVVCSCPTCGYLMKTLLRENACYSDAYQRSANAGADEMVIPDEAAGGDGFIRVKKSVYVDILKDNGLFSEIAPLERIALSLHVQDVGEFLARLHEEALLSTEFGRMEGRLVYYAPCHQREQAIASSYPELLALIPGVTIVPIGGAMDCCGMGGSLGYKRQFHEDSIRLGTPLIEKIKAAGPTVVVTDCLSCRLQFQRRLSCPVVHPLEILSSAYEAAGGV